LKLTIAKIESNIEETLKKVNYQESGSFFIYLRHPVLKEGAIVPRHIRAPFGYIKGISHTYYFFCSLFSCFFFIIQYFQIILGIYISVSNDFLPNLFDF